MVVRKKIIVDWELIYARRRTKQIRDNERGNRSRTAFECKIRDMVRTIISVRERREKLLGFEHQEKFKVTTIYNNGTVSIRSGTFTERINIRRLKKVHKKYSIISSALDIILGGK